MAYYKLHAYDADVRIPEFVGLKQDDEIAVDLRFAMDAENVETIDGVLQPQAAPTVMQSALKIPDKIETIARFHRRWFNEYGQGTNEFLVCAAGGKLYCRQAGDNIGWVQITMPESMPAFQSNVWSWVTYEKNEESLDFPLDVLLISNAKDGMYMVIPPSRPSNWGEIKLYTWQELKAMTWEEIYSEKWTVTKISPVLTVDEEEREYRFGVIERFKERLWAADISYVVDGSSNIIAEPDLLMYSAAYDPTDWRQYPYTENNQQVGDPEDGGGEISQPSWDGDRFTSLRAFGDQMIAFKGNRVWRVMGVGPGDFQMSEQYGGGTAYPKTIAVDVERILIAEKDGLSVYDGMTVNPFNRNYIESFWRTINKDAMDQMCATMFKHRYYLAVPTGKSTINDTLLVYDSDEGSFLIYKDMFIEDLLAAGDILYATSASVNGEVIEINHDSWYTELSSGKASKWETPWMDFNYKTIAKGGYEVYFNPQVKGAPMTFRFSIQTEKKTKSKTVTVQPTTFKEKQKRIRFGGTSRKFRLIIEALSHPQRAVWRLTGGIHMVVETDPD